MQQTIKFYTNDLERSFGTYFEIYDPEEIGNMKMLITVYQNDYKDGQRAETKQQISFSKKDLPQLVLALQKMLF